MAKAPEYGGCCELIGGLVVFFRRPTAPRLPGRGLRGKFECCLVTVCSSLVKLSLGCSCREGGVLVEPCDGIL